jgi:hypothetical protein
MQRIGLCLAVCLGCAVLLGSTSVKSENATTYAARIVAINTGVADQLFAMDGLIGYEPFMKLSSEGAKNIDDCIEFLRTRGHSDLQRDIAVLSMHRLGLEDYVSFLRRVAQLFDLHLVSADELQLAIVPLHSFSTLLIENYDREEVRSVLREIVDRPEIPPSTKSIIAAILSGQALADLQSFRRDCCSGPGTK